MSQIKTAHKKNHTLGGQKGGQVIHTDRFGTWFNTNYFAAVV